MPKDNIDYSDTIIYKIYCKDESINEVYVGHTTNFPVRKYQHKIACNNSKNDVKIYKIIRENGGWNNWNMIEIAKYNCKDSTEARIKEQYHYEQLKASLNSCPPYVDKKKCGKQQIAMPPTKSSNNEYSCEVCHYFTSKKFNIEKHNLTSKHKEAMKVAKSRTPTYYCNCGKGYCDNSGLWRHKKKCNIDSKSSNIIETKTAIDIDVIMELIKNNTEIQKKMLDIINNGTHNTNCNNTTNNKTFNLNLYLNETCKDAMNISEFVSSIKLNLEDLEHTGRKGYVEGISNIFLKNLNDIEDHMRPIHCSDQKREILYIKDNDKWEKECDEKPILTKAIKNVAHQNIKQIQTWRDKHPDCTSSDSRKNDLYLKIVSNSMNGLTEEEGKKNISKIISNVAKEVVIDKN